MDHQSQIERIRIKDLAESPKLDPLWEFANYAFTHASQRYPELGFEGKRFEQPSDFVEEMGPDCVTFIQYAPGSGGAAKDTNVIATAGCKPWDGALHLEERVKRMREEREAIEKSRGNGNEVSDNGFYTKEHEDQLLQQMEKLGPMTHSDGQEDVPRWEVMTVCVHPEWQKQGLANVLLEKIVEEVSSQVKASGRGPAFKLMVRIMKEINEGYWLSKRFKTVGEKFFEPAIETTGKPIAESTLHLPFLLHLNQPTLDNHSLVHSTSAEVSPITSHRNTEPRRLAQDGL
ncbi:MAG: hypothetical protein L6R40_007928 [Gallowayella cf. fulva]|nr:MAG: hypothetical protein L6R40_007928 [Xanthomendoza cf. fulva]